MNDPKLISETDLDSLFARARAHRPDTSASEFAFETRLMARLRAHEDTGSVWARVSWRMIPFFAACVAALALWQSAFASNTNDAATIAGLNNPVATDLLGN